MMKQWPQYGRNTKTIFPEEHFADNLELNNGFLFLQAQSTDIGCCCCCLPGSLPGKISAHNLASLRGYAAHRKGACGIGPKSVGRLRAGHVRCHGIVSYCPMAYPPQLVSNS